jgi:MipA family protein
MAAWLRTHHVSLSERILTVQNPCLPIASAMLFIFSSSLQARDISVGLGAGIAPEYEGAKKYKVIPFAALQIEDEWGSVSLRGPGIEVDLVPSRKLDAGPVVRYNFGRKGGISDPAVRLLPRVSGSVEAGGFVGTGLPLSVLGSDDPAILTVRVSAVTDVGSGHKGALYDGSIGFVRPFGDAVTVIGSLTATYASTNYMQAFFGVAAAGAAASGLAAYTPSSGLKDISATLVANTKLGGKWSVITVASYSRLVGDAAKSPIVTTTGSRNQAFGGVALSYTF